TSRANAASSPRRSKSRSADSSTLTGLFPARVSPRRGHPTIQALHRGHRLRRLVTASSLPGSERHLPGSHAAGLARHDGVTNTVPVRPTSRSARARARFGLLSCHEPREDTVHGERRDPMKYFMDTHDKTKGSFPAEELTEEQFFVRFDALEAAGHELHVVAHAAHLNLHQGKAFCFMS